MPNVDKAPAEHPSEQFLRFSHRNMVALLIVVIALGGTGMSLMLSPDGAVANRANLAWWLAPVAVAIVAAGWSSLRGRRWRREAPEVRMILDDEWRQANLARATRGALVAVLAAQWPLGLAVGSTVQTPPFRVALLMATTTITLGLVVFIGTFLILDRE